MSVNPLKCLLKKIYKEHLVYFFFLYLFLFIPHSIFAQSPPQISEGLHLVNSPVTVSLHAFPGRVITTQLKINNAGLLPQMLSGSVNGFTAFKDTGQPNLFENPPADNYFSWATITPKVFQIGPGEWKTIAVTFTVPKDAANDYYYAITFKPIGKVINDQTGLPQAGLKGGIATLVLLNVDSPNAHRSAKLESFTTDSSFYEYLPVKFAVKIKNTGNVHLVPKGNIFISLMHDDKVTLEINKANGATLANSIRSYTLNWDDGFLHYGYKMQADKYVLDSNGKKVEELQWNFNQLQSIRIGKFTAHVTMVYDDGKKDVPLDGEVSFWVIPWKILIGIAIIGLLFFIGIFASIRMLFGGIFKKK